MKTIKVNLKPPYHIHIGENIVFKLLDLLEKLNLGNYAIVITNNTIYSFYKKVIPSIFKKNKYVKFKFIVFPDTEKIKSFNYLIRILNKAALLNYKKRVFFICFGGGVIGDLGGFSASIYKRGSAYIQIPTTLLAQIDASIGGKTAIDLSVAKNLIGSFWQPRLVLSDVLFLNTLSVDQIREGLAEAIKYALIKDNLMLEFIINNYRSILAKDLKKLSRLICWCAKIKRDIIEIDEKETKGIRTILNFGHTIGHAIEASSKYRISHGKAISLGLIAALFISREEGILQKKEIIGKITALTREIGLPYELPFKTKDIMEALKRDKKFYRARIRMVLLKDIGKVIVKENVRTSSILKGLKSIKTPRQSIAKVHL